MFHFNKNTCNKFFKRLVIHTYVSVCMCTFVSMCLCNRACVCACLCPQRLEEGVRCPGAGVTGSCELPNMGTRNQTWMLCKNSKCSQPLQQYLLKVQSELPNQHSALHFVSLTDTNSLLEYKVTAYGQAVLDRCQKQHNHGLVPHMSKAGQDRRHAEAVI